MLELALDVGKQRRGAYPEEPRLEPRIAEFLLHDELEIHRVLGGRDAARRLEADDMAGRLAIGADRPRHGQRYRQRGIDALLAGRRLDEVGARHHRHP
jgi:hypothetical protein